MYTSDLNRDVAVVFFAFQSSELFKYAVEWSSEHLLKGLEYKAQEFDLQPKYKTWKVW